MPLPLSPAPSALEIIEEPPIPIAIPKAPIKKILEVLH